MFSCLLSTTADGDRRAVEALPGRLGGVRLAVVGEALEVGRRGRVEQDRDTRVKLQDGCRAPRRDRTLDGGRGRAGLGLAGCDEQQVTSLKDRSESLREHVGWH